MADISFRALGVSPDEYAVYKRILKEPPTNLSDFAKQAGLSRSTLYAILKTLKGKGLIKESPRDEKRIKYKALPPEKLLSFAQKQREELNKDIERFKKEIPFLYTISSIDNLEGEFDFIVFKGQDALEKIDKYILTSTEPMLGFSYEHHVETCFSFDKDGELIPNDYYDMVLKMGDRFVFPGDDKSIRDTHNFLQKYPILEGKWQPRWIDKEKFNMKINLYCFDDTVILSFGETAETDTHGYLIKNQKLADSLKSLSLFLWENANPII